MSTLPDNELDLEKLFLPAWAQEPASAKHYASYEGGGEDRRDRKGDRRPGRPPGRSDRPPGDGPRNRGPRPDQRGPRREGDRPRFDRGRGRPGPRPEERDRREAPQPLPEIELAFIPEARGVESLARQIKMTGRAYPLFDIARLVLQKPERHAIAFSIKKNPEGKAIQPLFLCALDDTLWLSEDEAIAHVLNKHFGTFYQAERTATEPPKGTYTFVAQCGMSGIILGPPNHHDYQNQLRKLHTERFSRLPFDAFKARVKIVRDEAVVKKWVEDQSWRTEYVCLNVPEPLRLGNREAVEKHFREIHRETIIKPVESQTLSGVAARNLRSPGLVRLVRMGWEDQRRFPLQIATVLSQQFASHGLQFFKVNKTLTHVSVARPHFLDLETTPVSEGVKQIIAFINQHPKATRRKLMESLAPAPAVIPVTPPAPAPAADATAAAAEPAPATPPAAPEPTPEQAAIISDLHWLIHQGHVIEFANGVIETAKRPVPKPVRPQPKAETPAAPAEPAASDTATVAETSELSAGTPTEEQAVTDEVSPTEQAPPEPEATAEQPEPVTDPAPGIETSPQPDEKTSSGT